MQVVKTCNICQIEKKLSDFFPAKTCKDGHRGACKICSRARARSQVNAEHRREYDKLYRYKNKEKLATKQRQWIKDNPDRHKARVKKWLSQNKEKSSAYTKKWLMKNLNYRSAYHKEYAKTHPDLRADIKRRKRARKRLVTVERFSSIEIYERDHWVCQICNKKVDRRIKYPNRMSPSLDHIMPLALHGTHERKNVQLAHLGCNVDLRENGMKQLRLF